MAKKKIVEPPKQFVYVFHDEDHGSIEVFSNLEDAKKLGWGDDDEEWEECRADGSAWRMSEYCAIYKREIL